VIYPRRAGAALLGLASVWLAIGAYSAGAETGGDFTGHLAPDGRAFYAVVDNDSTSWVSSVNLRTGARTRIVVPGGTDAIALSPSGRTLYVSDGRNAIVPVATATGQAGLPSRCPRAVPPTTSPWHPAAGPSAWAWPPPPMAGTCSSSASNPSPRPASRPMAPLAARWLSPVGDSQTPDLPGCPTVCAWMSKHPCVTWGS
jgi:hypothetical protein